MKKPILRIRPFLLMGAAILVFSCSKDDDNGSTETQVSQNELNTVLQTDEISGIADDVIRDVIDNGYTAKSSGNETCYVADWMETGYSIAFDNCKEGGKNLNGSLSVVFKEEGGSYAYTVTYDELTVGDIELRGTRTIVFGGEENSLVMDVTSDLSLTMGDGKVISEKGVKRIALIIGADSSRVTVDGDWVVGIDSNTYTVSIPKVLETQIGCEYVGKGNMTLGKNGLEVFVDFGDGSCDDVAELEYPDGTKETISLKE
ncbi:hypothetical protein RQM65_17825 [Pricia sp. S334]|uniref:Lipoprotein n=1 Tax=Pricia mediterranea TaxID=3076079 RepID=A0ABU3LBT8_9FLAO|nr:hypothetical protein [Pricia sp. S334]MDT7830532.1 hypothetical protein [Pricia sp. S334]